MNESNYPDDGWKELASSICLLAINDYYDAVTNKNERLKNDCERFFKSDWFTELSGHDGKSLMKRLKKAIPEFHALAEEQQKPKDTYLCPICSGTVNVTVRKVYNRKRLVAKCNSCTRYHFLKGQWDGEKRIMYQ